MENNKLEEALNQLILYYKKHTGVETIPLMRIVITDNFIDEIIKHEIEEWKRKHYMDNLDIVNNNNGLVLYPNEVNKEFKILISLELIKKTDENNSQHICTIFHEITHVIDYSNFVNDFNDGNYEKLENIENYFAFWMWTEFNAKRVSYKLYKMLIQGEQKSDEGLNYLIENEVPFQEEVIREQLQKHSNNIQQQIYSIIHYLARYYEWEVYDYENFENYKRFPSWFKLMCNDKIEKIYDFLKKNILYTDIKDKFTQLTSLLEDINK